jgi:putative SOS response-associated peptidase YedK
MCGRITTTQANPETIQQAFDLKEPPQDLSPRYNITPGQNILVVAHNAEDQNAAGWMYWGLIPPWAKERKIAHSLINARGESVHEKPAFRSAFKSRRCLIVADGFYEWRKNADGSKTPMHIRMADGQPFGIGGLWERWTDPDSGEIVTSCTIITTTPNELMAPIHNRMPVILPRDRYTDWLSRQNQDIEYLQSLLVPYDPAAMVAYEVSKRVNNPAYDAPDLIERVQ